MTPRKGKDQESILQQPVAKFEALPTDYGELVDRLKKQVEESRLKAALSVNRELILLYWQIGREVGQRMTNEGWGAKVIDRLANDLKSAFPEMKGFSPRNLRYMRSFADAWPDEAILQQLAAKIPWGHNVLLLDKVADPKERGWYVQQAIQNGWSRNVMAHQIESALYERQGRALTNFERALPAPQADLAQQLIKDPYLFDFLSLGPESLERDLERGLIEHLKKFLLELGVGFAFVGNQHHLEVGGEDFYLDLLFYHLKLRCYVVIELKIGGFKPEYAGKMNFYLSAVDDLMRHPDDRPSIGLILCKERNKTIVEYSLRDASKPIGVAAYQLTESLPEPLLASLPSVEVLAAELETVETVTPDSPHKEE